MRIGQRRASLLTCLLVATLVAGCGDETLYSRLSEQEANDMVALLYAAGMPASKLAGEDDRYTVTTDQDTFAGAVSLLRANGFPHERFDTLGEVFARKGFVSSPLEERARLNHALSQELARTLSSIDGVLMARVHLAVPERDQLNDVVHPASASVFIKHQVDRNLDGRISEIKALVVNGVENLPYENVTVVLFPADAEPARSLPAVVQPVMTTASAQLAGLLPMLGERPALPLLGGGLLAFCLLLGAAVSAWLRRRAAVSR